MSSQPIKVPGPDHPITIEPNAARIRVSLGGTVIADTTSSLSLQEASYPVVHYIPRGDVNMSLLERTDHASYCPYKGECSYFTIDADGQRSVNTVWSYEAPYSAVSAIREYLAFYPDRVSIEQIAG